LDHYKYVTLVVVGPLELAIKNFGNYEKLKSGVYYLKHGTETAVLSMAQ
jgi:hypothetical protein